MNGNVVSGLQRMEIVDASSFPTPDMYRESPVPPSGTDISVLRDWSGRGSHVDYQPNEAVPLQEGRFLGHGLMGGVYETTVRGQTFAWKRRYCRRQIGPGERKEIEILKKLSHPHIIQLVGTYTHRQFLGLLLYPVAECDMATFLDDMEAIAHRQSPEPSHRERLLRLGWIWDSSTFFWDNFGGAMRECVISKIGCLLAAVEYLHENSIRHKDLKPSNILLSQDRLWLTDFGSATDFSLLSASATDNGERGTPKYFAPEVAQFKPSGRAADMFSLGCILLEVLVLDRYGSLEQLKDHRPAMDKSYQANLDQRADWFALLKGQNSPRYRHLLSEIIEMLNLDPQIRPTAAELRERLAIINKSDRGRQTRPLFRECCTMKFISEKEHEEKIRELKASHQLAIQYLESKQEFHNDLQRRLRDYQTTIQYLHKDHEIVTAALKQQHKEEIHELEERIKLWERIHATSTPNDIHDLAKIRPGLRRTTSVPAGAPLLPNRLRPIKELEERRSVPDFSTNLIPLAEANMESQDHPVDRESRSGDSVDWDAVFEHIQNELKSTT